MAKARIGRPPKAPRERRNKWVLIRLTPGEHRELKRYAKAQRKTMAELLRQLALRQIGERGESKERSGK